jgi:catechol 2,3-dioxygenase-like lactoylglutathione lyase family enzyme
MVRARRLCPELAVGNVAEASKWYESVLAGMPVWTWKDQMAAVRLGDAELYLVRASKRGPSHVYLHVDDVRTLASTVTARLAAQPELGGEVREPLGERDWAMLELALVDPWGNRLRIGQPLRTIHETPGYVAHDADPRTP